MSFKTFGLGIVTVAAGTALATAPAHALSVGSNLNFGWSADAQTTSVDFQTIASGAGAGYGEFFVNPGTSGDFTAIPKNVLGVLTLGTVKDLSSFALPSNGISKFITFAGASSKFDFTLKSFSYVLNSDFQGYKFNGIFGDGSLADGSLSTPVTLPGVLTYAGKLTVTSAPAIPTPALLPGLIGLGLGVLRKRKAEKTAMVKAEV